MTLRRQVALGIVGIAVLVVVLLFTVVAPRLSRTFSAIERAEVEKNVDRVRNAVVTELSNLESTSHDWAAWDEPASFAQGARPSFAEENLMQATFVNLRLNFMVFYDSADRVVYVGSYGLEQSGAPLPGQFLTVVNPVLALWQSADDTSSRAGLMAIGDHLALVAIHPILASTHEPPEAGMLAIGRMLDVTEVERLASQIALPLLARLYRGRDLAAAIGVPF